MVSPKRGIGDGDEVESVVHLHKKPRRENFAKTSSHVSNHGIFIGEVYKSNMFKLQVDELLASITPKFSKFESSMVRLLQSLKTTIEQIPDRKPITLVDAELAMAKNEKIQIPFPDPRPRVNPNYLLHYCKPEHVNVAGSYALQTITKASDSLIIDVVVVMPSASLQDKDYLNHRYHARRAYYLACLAAGIKNSKMQKYRHEFSLLHGIESLPVLVLHPLMEGADTASKIIQSFAIRILPVLSQEVFAPGKLLPDKACLRTRSWTDSEGRIQPSPFYNGTILHDMNVTAYLRLQHDLNKESDKYREACILGRIWLQQRGFSSTVQGGGFGNFEWAVLMGLLLRGGGPKGLPIFSKGYSSYQLFKATVQFLATKNLHKSPQVVGDFKTSVKGSLSIPIFFDAERHHNILFKMTAWSYSLLRREAEATLASLKLTTSDQFDSTFISRTADALCRFDAVIEIPISALLNRGAKQDSRQTKLAKECEALYQVLRTTFTSRVALVYLHLPSPESWAVDRTWKPPKSGQTLIIGINFDSSQISRTIDHGPSADQEKAASEFRIFWGEKAELRRFKDGRILESLIWNSASHESIFQQMLFHSLRRHYGEDFLSVVRLVPDVALGLFNKSSSLEAESSYQSMIEIFQKLREILRGLEEIPLRVAEVLPADSQLSYSSLYAPGSRQNDETMLPANAIIQFESSARWPDDIAAIQRTKTAFMCKILDALEQSELGVQCKIGLENEEKTLHNQSFLDVVFPSALTIRLRIHHDREEALLEAKLKRKGASVVEKAEAGFALSQYKQTFIHAPSHCQAVKALAIREPSFSPTVRTIKRWFAGHLLSSHFPQQILELFTAQSFTTPFPWSPPASTNAGLCRVLYTLSRWDWQSEPWITNFAVEEMTEEHISSINTRYEAWRRIDPAMNRVVTFVASNIDGDGTTWTDLSRPARVVASRMTHLAKAAVAAIRSDGLSVNLPSLFNSTLDDYDFVIHTNRQPSKQNDSKKMIESNFKNLVLQKAVDSTAVGFEPHLWFIKEVEELYSGALVLFHDLGSLQVIAGLWNPQTSRAWKLRLGYSSAPDTAHNTSSQKVQNIDAIMVNREAILNEIARLGGSLIAKIVVKQHANGAI